MEKRFSLTLVENQASFGFRRFKVLKAVTSLPYDKTCKTIATAAQSNNGRLNFKLLTAPPPRPWFIDLSVWNHTYGILATIQRTALKGGYGCHFSWAQIYPKQ